MDCHIFHMYSFYTIFTGRIKIRPQLRKIAIKHNPEFMAKACCLSIVKMNALQDYRTSSSNCITAIMTYIQNMNSRERIIWADHLYSFELGNQCDISWLSRDE